MTYNVFGGTSNLAQSINSGVVFTGKEPLNFDAILPIHTIIFLVICQVFDLKSKIVVSEMCLYLFFC